MQGGAYLIVTRDGMFVPRWYGLCTSVLHISVLMLLSKRLTSTNKEFKTGLF